MSGTCPTSVSKSALDGVSHARWLTLAIRILVLYMTFAIPPFPLQRLAYFIIFCYAPQWFAFRVGWRATDAPRVFFQGMKQMLKLLPEEQAKVLPVLEHNAYWFHPENLLLSMLSDDNQAVRADAIDSLENSTPRSSYYIPVCVGGRGVALRAAIYPFQRSPSFLPS